MEIRETNEITMSKARKHLGVVVALLVLAAPRIAIAHHSVGGFFDTTQTVEIEGVLTSTKWQNPHSVFSVDVEDASGEVTEWQIETGAVAVLTSRGLSRELLGVGNRIRILGNPSNRGRNEIWANNVLLSNGEEAMITIFAKPYFSLQEHGGARMAEAVRDPEIERQARLSADGIFRVWSAKPPAPGDSRLFNGSYPINAAAEAGRQEYRETFDPSDIEQLGCHVYSMPSIMSNPAWMEFVRDGSDILLKFFYGDNERLIDMDSNPASAPSTHSLMGHSIGRWDGGTLVVEVTHMQPGILDVMGTPHSEDIRIVERFTPSANGTQLDYVINVTDPEYFTETFEQERRWIWLPEIPLGRYACEEEQ